MCEIVMFMVMEILMPLWFVGIGWFCGLLVGMVLDVGTWFLIGWRVCMCWDCGLAVLIR